MFTENTHHQIWTQTAEMTSQQSMQPSLSFISWPKFQNKSFPCTGFCLVEMCAAAERKTCSIFSCSVRRLKDYLQKKKKKLLYLQKHLIKNNYSTWWDARTTCFHCENNKALLASSLFFEQLYSLTWNLWPLWLNLPPVTSFLIMRWNKSFRPAAVDSSSKQSLQHFTLGM